MCFFPWKETYFVAFPRNINSFAFLHKWKNICGYFPNQNFIFSSELKIFICGIRKRFDLENNKMISVCLGTNYNTCIRLHFVIHVTPM